VLNSMIIYCIRKSVLSGYGRSAYIWLWIFYYAFIIYIVIVNYFFQLKIEDFFAAQKGKEFMYATLRIFVKIYGVLKTFINHTMF